MSLDTSLDLLFKAETKAMLKALRTSKKLKYMDDSKVVEEARLTTLRDEWLITCGKPMSETKAQMKKIAEAEKRRPKRRIKPGKKPKKETSYGYQKISNNQQSKSSRSIQRDIIAPIN